MYVCVHVHYEVLLLRKKEWNIAIWENMNRPWGPLLSKIDHQFVQSLSHDQLFVTPWSSTPGFPVHQQLSELAQTQIHWVSDAIQPSCPLSSPSPSAFSLSQHQGLFQWVSYLHQVAKVLAFQLQHQPSNEYSGLISFRVDWFDLLAPFLGEGRQKILFSIDWPPKKAKWITSDWKEIIPTASKNLNKWKS